MTSPSRLPSRRSRPVSMIVEPGSSLNTPSISNGFTTRQAKRKSLLPTFTRKASGEATIKEDEVEGNVSRPESQTGSGSDSKSSVRDSVEAEPRNASEQADRRAMPPPAARHGRPTSMYSAGGPLRAPSTRYQTESGTEKDGRAEALAALTGADKPPRPPPKESGIKRAPSTRLPQSPAVSGLARTSSIRKQELPVRTSSINAVPSSSTTEKRTIAQKARPPSIDGSLLTRLPNETSSASPTRSNVQRPSARPQSQILPPPRPAFNTYQQHYSPAKSSLPKPPVPTARSTKPPPETEAADPETAMHQIELLQLSLLHQASFATMREYETSAKHKLGKQHALLRKKYEAIRDIEREQQRIANLTALESWCPEPSLLVEQLRILAAVHAEITALHHHRDSRYLHLVRAFERWITNAESTLRSSNGDFVEPMSSDWHKAHTSLALRLRSLQREMSLLPPAPAHSEESEGPRASLSTVLESCGTLLDGMLKELEMMSKLEREVLQREKTRVGEEVAALLDGKVLKALAGEKWVPAWRAVALDDTH